MELIKIIKRILYKFKKKHLITIITVLFMLLITFSNFSKVSATTIDVVQDNEVLDSTVNYLQNVVYTNFNVDFKEGISFVFYDEAYMNYRIIYVPSNNCSNTMGLFSISDWGYKEVRFGWGNNCSLYCFNIPINGLEPTKEDFFKSGWEGSTFNNVTNHDCFNLFNLMWACAPSTWSNYNKIEEIQNNNYIIKPFSTYPFEIYNGNSFNIDGNLVLDAGSCQIGESEFLPFMLEIQDITNSTLKTRILLNTSCSYYDDIDKNYKIPFKDLEFYLFNNIEYQFNIVLFDNENIYDFQELFSLVWDGTYINPNISGGNEEDNENNNNDNNNNVVQDTNNFLKDETVNDSDFELPTVEVNDPSANFFDTIFTGLYNAVTKEDDIIINVEVMETDVKVSSADFNFLNDSRFTLLKNILSFSWICGIGIYILKDIRKILDKIKNGDVDTAVTDDVKANMV